ncbi:sulfite exporter TauE/SafE family protein [Halosquirtibacter xylanolyticus]|uniref:sulfite exporter TauE/SafE family protein n=1 Tax=Halosquirtibacter xylanolyticus TaxID=3374599 RepID=UPI003749ADB3|nr:sulfite exporter TauE/SafE family protein [Prolixibacteraceae bacterium]
MENILNPLNTSWTIWALTALCAFITGLSKSGLKGFAMVTIPILAFLYGAKVSVAILMPFLIFGDLFAIISYRQKVPWHYIKNFFPWAILGIILAAIFGNHINDIQFKYTMGIAVLVCLCLVLWKELRPQSKLELNKGIFSYAVGIAGGFATMIGNAAGPIFNLYLITLKLPKRTFVFTGACFYLTLNTLKIPLHVFYWHTLSWDTLKLNFVLLPFLLIGGFTGKYIIKFIPEKVYRTFILVVTFISAIMLFL